MLTIMDLKKVQLLLGMMKASEASGHYFTIFCT